MRRCSDINLEATHETRPTPFYETPPLAYTFICEIGSLSDNYGDALMRRQDKPFHKNKAATAQDTLLSYGYSYRCTGYLRQLGAQSSHLTSFGYETSLCSRWRTYSLFLLGNVVAEKR